MTSRRHLVALGLVGLAASLLLQASCVGVFGVDVASLDNAVEEMCSCVQLRSLGKPAECEAELTDRFVGVGSIDRTAWLKSYSDHCTSCEDVLPCLAQRPLCVLDECTQDAECCPVVGSGKKRCIKGHCGS